MAQPNFSQRGASYADYLQWDEGRFEIVDGVVFAMRPAPNRAHQRVIAELGRRRVSL